MRRRGRSLATELLQQVLDEMEVSLDIATEKCPYCGSINLFPGFSRMMAFICRECGESVRRSDDPDIDRFFGASDDSF
jgi:uncharacterized protein (DUF983 family)